MIDAKDHLGTYRGGGTATTCTHCGEPITVGRLASIAEERAHLANCRPYLKRCVTPGRALAAQRPPTWRRGAARTDAPTPCAATSTGGGMP